MRRRLLVTVNLSARVTVNLGFSGTQPLGILPAFDLWWDSDGYSPFVVLFGWLCFQLDIEFRGIPPSGIPSWESDPGLLRFESGRAVGRNTVQFRGF